MVQSVLARLDPSQIVNDPYPFVHTTEALAPDYYQELALAFPSMERIVAGRPLVNNHAYLVNAPEVMADEAIPEIWRDFFAYHSSRGFLQQLLDFWRPAIEREYPDIEDRFGKPLAHLTSAVRRRGKQKRGEDKHADVMMDVQFGINSPVTAPTTVRGPHVDNNQKLFAGLLYFRLPEDNARGGDLTPLPLSFQARPSRRPHGLRGAVRRALQDRQLSRQCLHHVAEHRPQPARRDAARGDACAPPLRQLHRRIVRIDHRQLFPLRRSLIGAAGSRLRQLVHRHPRPERPKCRRRR
jgi:hypothetical protein